MEDMTERESKLAIEREEKQNKIPLKSISCYGFVPQKIRTKVICGSSLKSFRSGGTGYSAIGHYDRHTTLSEEELKRHGYSR